MRARWAGAALTLSMVVGLLVPPSSLAAETFSYGPGSVTFARVRATHGYRANFSENDKGYLFVRVKGHGATTDFAIHAGRAPGDHLIGDFGRRGSFDLRFVPVGKPEPIPIVEWCQGSKGSWQPGYLVGRAHFRTERGYAQFRVHRVPAAEESWAHLTCEFGHFSPPGHPKEKRMRLTAVASTPSQGDSPTPKRTLTFRATQFYRHAKAADRRVAFAAELSEMAGRISIRRKAEIATDERSLLFPGGPQLPEEVEVMPPLPFTGSAEFLRTHESTFTWSGDLAVTFPGLDPVRLAGPSFSAGVCAVEGCASRKPEGE